MAEVLFLRQGGLALRQVRNGERLTLKQAGAALGVSPVTLEHWERGAKPQVSPDEALRAYREYRANTNEKRDKDENMLFGAFPLRVARDVLGLEVKQLAELLGYSESSWRKIEANARTLPQHKLDQLEDMVSEAWDSACG